MAVLWRWIEGRDTVRLVDIARRDAEVTRMSQWAEIRHLHLVEGVPKKEIARRLQSGRQDGAPRRGPADAAGAGVATAVLQPGPVAGPDAAAVRRAGWRTTRSPRAARSASGRPLARAARVRAWPSTGAARAVYYGTPLSLYEFSVLAEVKFTPAARVDFERI